VWGLHDVLLENIASIEERSKYRKLHLHKTTHSTHNACITAQACIAGKLHRKVHNSAYFSGFY